MPFFGLFGPPNVEKLKTKRNVRGLIKALHYQKDSSIRRAAAQALNELNEAQAAEALIGALDDTDEEVRYWSAWALGKIGGKRVVDRLAVALSDSREGVRQAAVGALSNIKDPRVVDLLIEAYVNNLYNVRIRALRGLGNTGDARAVKPLVMALGEKGHGIREAALESLELLGWVPSTDTERAIQAIAHREWDNVVSLGAMAVEPLVTTIKSWSGRGEPYEKYQAAKTALGNIRDVKAVELLAIELHNEQTQKLAIHALVEIGTPSISTLVAALDSQDWQVQKLCIPALNTLGWQPVTDLHHATKAAVLKNWDEIVRIGVPALPILLALTLDTTILLDDQVSVRTAIETLLKREAPKISSAHLQVILALKDVNRVETKTEFFDGYEYEKEVTVLVADGSHLRQLARQELIRRGEKV